MNTRVIKCTNRLQEFLTTWKKRNWIDRKNDHFKLRVLGDLCRKGADLDHLERQRGFGLIPHVFWSKKLIQFLLDEGGADVNARNEKGDTALHLAIRHEKMDSMIHLITFLLDQGADPKIVNLRGENVLFTLTRFHRNKKQLFSKVAKTLIERNGGVELVRARNNYGESLLHLFDLELFDPGFIEYFDPQDIDVTTSTCLYFQTPLMAAAREKRLESCRILIEMGAFINAVDLQGYTALHHAVLNETQECAELLLRMGSDHKAKSSSGRDVMDLICTYSRASKRVSLSLFTYEWSETDPITCYNQTLRIHTVLRTEDALLCIEHVDTRGALEQWDLRDPLRPLPEDFAEYECLKNLNLSESTTKEEIIVCAMNFVAKLLEGNNYDKFWNLFRSFSRSQYFFRISDHIFDILNFLSEDLKNHHVEEFVSIEEIDFESLLKALRIFDCWLKELMESNDKEQRISHVHSIARLVVACFDKLMHETNCRKVSDTCMKLYVRLCHALTSLHVRFADVISETAFNENKRLLRSLLDFDLMDKDCNSLMHLVLGGEFYEGKFEPELVVALLDSFGINVKTRNRMGFEPSQTTNYYWRRNLSFLVPVFVKMADRGAHVDARNADRERPTLREVFEKEERLDLSFKYDTLQCACARVLVRSMMPYVKRVPKQMVDFIRQHK